VFETVEAIQAHLEYKGWVLYPGFPERPPFRIFDEEIFQLDLRVFAEPNPNGPFFYYKRNEQASWWNLDPTTKNIEDMMESLGVRV
jgi:hypothetical protein